MRNLSVFLICITLSFFGTVDSRADFSIIPVAKFIPADMVNEVPAGWNLDKKYGNHSMEIKEENNLLFLHLTSSGDSSFGLRKEFKVDVKKFPILCWRWKANKLPSGGDIRKSSTDDQALQLYVAFHATGFPAMTNTPVIGYIWDTEAPKGWSGRSPQLGADKVRYIVLRNRTDQTGQWFTERRNLYKDYKKLFGDIKGGEPQGFTTGVQIHINSQHTKSPADSLIGEIYFSADPSDIALAEAVREIKQTQDLKISAIKPPPPPKISAVKPPPAPKISTAKKQIPEDCLNINFEFSPESTDIGDKYDDQMETIVKYLIKNPKTKITMVGHSDNIGKSQHNLVISKKRATSVKNYLVEKFNIDPQRLNVKGVDSIKSAANSIDKGRKNNNYVTINECP